MNKRCVFCWIIVFWLGFNYNFLFIYINRINFPVNLNSKLIIQTDQAPIKGSSESQYNVRELIGLSSNLIDENLTGKNLTIAIFDTGIYPYHEVFTNNGSAPISNKIIAFYDAFDQKEENPEDIHWHGTYVSSIAVGNSSIYHGIAPGAKLVIVKVFNISEEDEEVSSSIQVIKNGIDWILENKNKFNVRVVSMSFGLESTSDITSINILNSITESLIEAGIVVVAAVGNDGDEGLGLSTIHSPADAKSVIGVGGVNSDGGFYSKSSKGPSSENIIKPDVCAPAVGIYGAIKDNIGSNNSYAYHSGTSAATPIVSGLVTLMLEKDPSLNPSEVKSIISLTSIKTENNLIIKDNLQGWGVVQGYAALDALNQNITFKNNNSISIFLGDNNNQEKVWCRRLYLQGGMHYFFDLAFLNDAAAELYLFDISPNSYGEPLLSATSINQFDLYRRAGIFVPNSQEYFIVVKIIFGTGSGNFLLSLIFDYRLMIVILISVLLTIGVIILYKDLKKLSNELKQYHSIY